MMLHPPVKLCHARERERTGEEPALSGERGGWVWGPTPEAVSRMLASDVGPRLATVVTSVEL